MKKWLVALAAAACGCSSAAPRVSAPSSSREPGVVSVVIDRGALDADGYWVANAAVDDEKVIRAVEKNPIVGQPVDDREHRVVAQVDFHPRGAVAVSTFRAHEMRRFAVGPGCRLEIRVGAEVRPDGLPRVTFHDALACSDGIGAMRSVPEPRLLAAPREDDAEDCLRYFIDARDFVADADRYVELAFVAARRIGDLPLVAALADKLAQIRAARRTLDDRAPLGIESSLDEARAAVDAAKPIVEHIARLQAEAREAVGEDPG